MTTAMMDTHGMTVRERQLVRRGIVLIEKATLSRRIRTAYENHGKPHGKYAALLDVAERFDVKESFARRAIYGE